MSHDDFAFEPIPGLPAHLPRGERMLCQTAPSWKSLAWRGLYVRPVAVYFAALMTWRVGEGLAGGGSIFAAGAYALELVPVAAAAIAVLVGLAWAYARSTIYTITDRRLVIRSGVALPMTVNIPFKAIESAALRLAGDGKGDIAVKTRKSDRVYGLALWPNLKPWNLLGRPEPMLRGIPDAERIAGVLASALQASAAADGEAAAMPPVDPVSAGESKAARVAMRSRGGLAVEPLEGAA